MSAFDVWHQTSHAEVRSSHSVKSPNFDVTMLHDN